MSTFCQRHQVIDVIVVFTISPTPPATPALGNSLAQHIGCRMCTPATYFSSPAAMPYCAALFRVVLLPLRITLRSFLAVLLIPQRFMLCYSVSVFFVVILIVNFCFLAMLNAILCTTSLTVRSQAVSLTRVLAETTTVLYLFAFCARFCVHALIVA